MGTQFWLMENKMHCTYRLSFININQAIISMKLKITEAGTSYRLYIVDDSELQHIAD
jgi:hypothetical protein